MSAAAEAYVPRNFPHGLAPSHIKTAVASQQKMLTGESIGPWPSQGNELEFAHQNLRTLWLQTVEGTHYTVSISVGTRTVLPFALTYQSCSPPTQWSRRGFGQQIVLVCSV